MKAEHLLEELVSTYQGRLAQGMCAHAALALVVNFSYVRGKEEGLTFEECMDLARQMQAQIKAIQEG